MVLLINGSPKEHGCTDFALNLIKEELGKEGIETETLWIGKEPGNGCLACNHCHREGKCIIDDEVNRIHKMVGEIEGMVIGSPVHYAAPAGALISFLDRLFYSGYGGKFDGIPAASIVTLRRGGATSAFNQINNYFTINSMPIVSSTYWNMLYGNKPSESVEDEEGVSVMRTLGRNLAYMIKIMKLGKENGIAFPKRERNVYTNFIRKNPKK